MVELLLCFPRALPFAPCKIIFIHLGTSLLKLFLSCIPLLEVFSSWLSSLPNGCKSWHFMLINLEVKVKFFQFSFVSFLELKQKKENEFN